MNKQEAIRVARLIGDAVAPIAAANGLKVEAVNSRYGEGELTLTIKTVSTDPGLNPMVTAWKRYATLFGLPENGLGQKVVIRGQTYTINGLDMGRRKYCVAAVRRDGKQFFLTEDSVRRALGSREAVEA